MRDVRVYWMVALTAVVVPTGSAVAQQSRVFVTSSVQNGNLGGLAGADMICNDLAMTAGLGGTWVAWLSTSSVDAVDRLTPGSGPFVRASDTSTVVANDITDLTDGTLDNAILLNEIGGPAPPPVAAWTGTGAAGVSSGNTCIDWTTVSIDEAGTIGQPEAVDFEWTDDAVDNCGPAEVLSIYCFETAAAPTLPTGAAVLLTLLLVAAGASLIYRRSQAAR